MKLIKFRIKNFKSVFDTEECELASDITILAGKNEAGKTVILQALEKFNQDKKFTENDKPLENPELEPEVILTFKLSRGDLDEINEDFEIPNKVNKKALLEIPFSIIKSFNNEYKFSGQAGSIIDLLIKNYAEQNEKLFKDLNENWVEIKKIFKEYNIQNYPLNNVNSITFSTVNNIKVSFLPSIENFIIQLPIEKQEEGRRIIENIKNILIEIENNENLVNKNKKILLKICPFFVLFDAFDENEMLPFEIELEKARDNQAVKNYCTLANLNLDSLIAAKDNTQEIIGIIRGASAKIEGDFKEFWKQGEKKIDLRLTLGPNNKLVFGFYERGKKKPFQITQRSKGLQWFLSFYLVVGAECSYNSIILIDEPGLFVHAKAQQDILNVLETNFSKTNQIIFTTHSPYLIDPNRLDRVRLVVKDLKIKKGERKYIQKGTKIYSLTKEINIDRDTLTPIITAIGLDISRSLTIAAENNIVVEGPSDYFYLQSALKFCKINPPKQLKQFHIIPCTGANNIPSIISILLGWELNFVVVLDNDPKGKEIYDILTEKLSIKREKIKFISEKENYEIEDLFTKTDFNKYILNKPENYELNRLNPQVIPNHQKVIFSKQFFDLVNKQNIEISQETKENFKNLLDNIFRILLS